MRLRHIEIFNAVYVMGSVSGAARFLNITQPTASKILKHAEDQIGFPLFKRIRGRLVATDEAEILYRETKDIFDRVKSLEKIIQSLLETEKGVIRLSAISALGLEHVPRAIVTFQERYPDVNFEFQTRHYDNLLPAILEKEKDIGIVFNPQVQRGLEYIDLGVGEFVCIYSGDEFDDNDERIKITDITEHKFIGIENSGPLADLLNEMVAESGVKLKTSIVAQTYFVALNLVAMGGGIAIVDEFTATSSGVGDVKFKKFDPPVKFSINAVHKDINPPSKLALNFLKFFKTEILDKRII